MWIQFNTKDNLRLIVNDYENKLISVFTPAAATAITTTVTTTVAVLLLLVVVMLLLVLLLQRLLLHLLVHKFTYHKSILPIVFSHILMIINYFMNIILVGKHCFTYPGCHTSVGHKIKYKTCKLWNNLPRFKIYFFQQVI